MRPIDADALKAESQKRQEGIERYGEEQADCFYSASRELSIEWWCVEDMIDNAPTVSTDDHVYRAGYTQAIKDIIEYMDNSDVLEDYVDPYEIGGFMLCLKNVGDTLIKELSD